MTASLLRNLAFFILVCFLFTSCSKIALDITPRKYRPGYHVQIFQSKKPKSNQNNFATRQHKESQQVRHRGIANKTVTHTETIPGLTKKAPVSFNQPAERMGNSMKIMPSAENKEHQTEVRKEKLHDTQHDDSIRKSSKGFYWFAGIAGILSTSLFMLNRRRMAKLSRWSARNSKVSMTLQLLSHVALSLVAFMTGSILYNHGVEADPVAVNIFTGLFLGASALYPLRKRNQPIFQSAYNKAKLADLTLILSGVAMSALLGNHVTSERLTASQNHFIAIEASQNFFESLSAKADQIDSAYFNEYDPSSGEKMTGEQIGLLILAIFLFVLFVLALIGLSCYIACSGNGALAAVVLVGGLGLFITLLILAIKAINKMNDKKE